MKSSLTPWFPFYTQTRTHSVPSASDVALLSIEPIKPDSELHTQPFSLPLFFKSLTLQLISHLLLPDPLLLYSLSPSQSSSHFWSKCAP